MAMWKMYQQNANLNEHKDIHLHQSSWFLCTYYLSLKKNVTVRNAHTAQCTVLCGILHKYASIHFIYFSAKAVTIC